MCTEERLCDSNSRKARAVQRSPGEGRDERAGRVGENLRGGAVARVGMVVAVLERGLAWLACARGTGAEEVEGDKDYARCAEGQGEHGYASQEGGGGTRGREGALAEAIDGEGGCEEEGDEGKVVVEHDRVVWDNPLPFRWVL